VLLKQLGRHACAVADDGSKHDGAVNVAAPAAARGRGRGFKNAHQRP
jgi:hypothetical protein